jgi:hypothetical protein
MAQPEVETSAGHHARATMNPNSGNLGVPADRARDLEPTPEGDRSVGFDGDRNQRLRQTARLRMAFVFILTGAVVLFALAIVVWMYWLSSQVSGGAVSVS